MGQKVLPIGLRIGINRTWDSVMFGTKDYGRTVNKFNMLRDELKKKLRHASVSKVIIKKLAKRVDITVYSARPGVIIGKKGSDIDALNKYVRRYLETQDVNINLVEIKRPEASADLIGQSIARQIEARANYRRVMKKCMQNAMRNSNVEGIRVQLSGRLAGVDIARTEWYREGRVPLHTFRANIDYAEDTARTTYGAIGIKIWIYKGDTGDKDPGAFEKSLQ